MRFIFWTAALLSTFWVHQSRATEYCFTPPDTKTYLQETIGRWKILRSKCSCTAYALGTSQSSVAIHANRPSTAQLTPSTFIMLITDHVIKDDPSDYAMRIDGFEVEAQIGREPTTQTLFAEPRNDIFESLSAAHVLSFGPYNFSLKDSRKAMSSLLACFSTLTGN